MIAPVPARKSTISVFTTLAFFVSVASPVAAACSDEAAPGVDWSQCETDKIDLQGLDLSNAVLTEASFPSAHLRNSTLSNADLTDANDEDIVEAAHEAISMAEGLSRDEFDDDGEDAYLH